ncbi:T9SS type A sorting domain-containing protein [Hymenobacter chitinivorans]|uniref:Putative secreted protein (Por secretion system target) n=1 Tax=Hymenobacter chitinivorans DSM 11115 TaxID=1121954 RepID=A0A2M9B8Z8_9BACT|nr:T9SS type A sorting domain-containing protein [Hymenobacter chitinivorans]PJJ54423.1 putative secreted protein (Por secretion system target) [Hymenobacter chitinivorans DSM 11115]
MRQFLAILFLLSAFGGLAEPAAAQTPFGFEYRSVANVVHGTQTLAAPWVGGLNTAQFSSIDLDGDARNDLYLFDRQTRRSYTYLNAANPATGGRMWQYAPEYQSLFPKELNNWVQLRDYDCDGRPDIFTMGSISGSIRVYRNVATGGGRPAFQLITDELLYVSGGSQININTGGYNTPAIEDVNGDGRLDITTFNYINSTTIHCFLNTSTAACGGLTFAFSSPRWGGVKVCYSTCSSFVFGTDECRSVLKPNHTSGNNLLPLDLDGDGDKDLLTARDNCAELVRLTNEGTQATAVFSAAGQTANFPAATPVRLPNFPAPYSLDVTFDGRPDLVLTPNVYDHLDTIDTHQNVWFYENTSATTVPSFAFRQNDFLQKDMLDTGDKAAPAFGDLTGDGLKDLLIGGVSRATGKGFYRASLWFYQNVGTASQPVFKLITNDYLGLSGKKYGSLRPVLVDLNRDGALDLVFSAFTLTNSSYNFIAYCLNSAPASQAAVFNAAAPTLLSNLPNRSYDTPTFTDIDGDGYVDMLLSTNTNSFDYPGESLRYYRNNGSQPLNEAFTVVNNDYGRLRTPTNERPNNLATTVADFDGDNQPDLVTIDELGQLHFYGNFRGQSGLFMDRTDVLYNKTLSRFETLDLGSRIENLYTLAAADVDNDGKPELFVGTEDGGVVALGVRSAVLSTKGAVAALPLSVYPNPATTTATVQTPQPTRLTVLDVLGRPVRTAATLQVQHTLELRGLAPGVYLVRAETAKGQTGVQRLVVQ